MSDFDLALRNLLGRKIVTETTSYISEKSNDLVPDTAFWRKGAALNIETLLKEPLRVDHKGNTTKSISPRTLTSAVSTSENENNGSSSDRLITERAITDANPPPPMDSLAVLPPETLMNPAANLLLNQRLETALMNNEVEAAQRILSVPGNLEQLCQEPLFAQACKQALGIEPTSLLGISRSSLSLNQETGRIRKSEEVDELIKKFEVDRIKKLSIILTDFRDIAKEEDKKRLKKERERIREIIIRKGRPPSPKPKKVVLVIEEEGVTEDVKEDENEEDEIIETKAPPAPTSSYSKEMIAKWGLANLQKHGFKALEKYGLKLCDKWGVRALDLYRLEHLEKFGITLLDTFGADACVRHGKQALAMYPFDLLEKYGELVCSRYPLDLLSMYSPDVLDVWPHTLLREFPLKQLEKYPLDLLRKYPLVILEKYPIDVLRKYALVKIEYFGPGILRAFGLETAERYGKDICDEALRLELEPEAVDKYHKERIKREERISTANALLNEIYEQRTLAIQFAKTAPGADGPSPAMLAAQRLAEQQAAALKLAMEQKAALERAEREAKDEYQRAQQLADELAAQRRAAETKLAEIISQRDAITVATMEAEALVAAHSHAQDLSRKQIQVLSSKNDQRRMEIYKEAAERAKKTGLMKEVKKETDEEREVREFEEKVQAGKMVFNAASKTSKTRKGVQEAVSQKSLIKVTKRI
jgi:hypothetical protein